jgi:hypothetical protein
MLHCKDAASRRRFIGFVRAISALENNFKAFSIGLGLQSVWEAALSERDFERCSTEKLPRTSLKAKITAGGCLSIAAAVLPGRNICGNSMIGAAARGRLCCSRCRPRDRDAYGGKGVIHAGAPTIC